MPKTPWRPPPQRPYKARDPAVTSAMMSRVRNKENKAEILLRKALWRRGLRYRLYHRKLVGRPDIVFIGPRVVVFVDGDYWHGRAIVEQGVEAFRATLRTERREWWVAKITRNIERDQEVAMRLRASGWTVVRVWESEVKADLPRMTKFIEGVVRRCARSTGRA